MSVAAQDRIVTMGPRTEDARVALEQTRAAVEHECSYEEGVEVAWRASGPSRSVLERALWLLDAEQELERDVRLRTRAVLQLARDKLNADLFH
jgi:hypothetical protein